VGPVCYFLQGRCYGRSQFGSTVARATTANLTTFCCIVPQFELQLFVVELRKGAELESDSVSQTLLHRAATGVHERVVKLLLKKGVELESKDCEGWMPLWGAAARGDEAVVKLLLEKGAELESKDHSGQTPLGWAAANGHEVVVKLLLEKGAEREPKNFPTPS
jgi:ankyrin repeat protein